MKRIGLIFALILALLLTMLPMNAMAAVGDGAEFEDGDISVPVGPGGNVPVPGTYTVTFKDRNGSTLSSEKYTHGATLTFPQVQDPIVDVYGTHTFVGWRDSNGQAAPEECIGTATYTATYETEWNAYTVTFKNEDGSTLATGSGYHYGDTVHVPADPTKADDDTYTYTFAGWDKEIVPVTGDAVYTATYTKTEKNPIDTSKNGWIKENGKWYYYQAGITVKNAWMQDTTGWCYLGADGAMVTNTWAKDGTGWCYLGADGRMVYNQWVKDSIGWRYVGADGYMITNAWAKDAQGWCWLDASGYVVYGQWVEAGGNKYYVNANGYRVTGEQTIDGKNCYFDENGIYHAQCTVIFKNEDGTILSSRVYYEGDTVQIPAAPYKPSDVRFTYTFAGWDKTVTTVTADVTYTATYKATWIDYTVTFKNEDGSTLATGSGYHYGDTVHVPADPTKAADAKYTYTFDGWDKEIVPVTGDAVYTATYKATWIDYTVTFKNGDGSILATGSYHYGDLVNIPANPTKADDAKYTYTFDGWDKEIVPVTGDAVYTATYKATWIDYTVTFKNEDGSILATGSYHYGDTVHIPANPTKADDATYTYTFAGWDKEITSVTGDAVYTATYTKTEKNSIDTSKNGWIKEGGEWYYYQKGVTLKNAWMKDTKGWCFLGEDGAMETDTFVRDSKGMAYVDASGYYYEINDWKYLDGKWYYLEKGYRVQNAWRKDSKGWCFLEADGAMATDTFVRDSKGMAYVDASGYYYEINGWKYLDGVWYYLEKGYRVQSAWRKDSKGWCYLGADGAMLTETWVKDSQGWCWVDASGYMVYNKWVPVSGNQYYVDASGYRVTGEHTIEGETYYFDENGVCQASFLIIFKNADGTVLSSKRYAEGAIVKVPADPTKAPDATYTYTFAGWDKEIVPVTGDAVYTATYTKEERPAGSLNGWVQENGKLYYYEQGVMVTNAWKKDTKGWCYLGADGAMVTNRWIKDSVGWCYVGGDGYCLTNSWVKDSTGWCYLDANGRMVYNRWVGSGSTWYYIDGNGYMLASTSKVIDRKRYYFNASGLCTNP